MDIIKILRDQQFSILAGRLHYDKSVLVPKQDNFQVFQQSAILMQ